MATIAITPDQETVVAEIFIAAPPERVFQAITDPNQLPRWWGQQGKYRITEWHADLRPGGKWSSIGMGSDGTPFRVGGEYLEVDPPRLLVHTWEKPSWSEELKTVVRWELEPHSVHGLHRGPQKIGMGTMVRLPHEGFAGTPKEAVNHGEGWKRVLAWMQAFVERGETADTRKGAQVG